MNKRLRRALLCCTFLAAPTAKADGAPSHPSPESLGFVSGGVHPAFGQTWVAPDGVAWYGVAKATDGTPRLVSATKAFKLCREHGLRLPEREDYELLTDTLGGADYLAPEFLELAGNVFATATVEAVHVAGHSFPVSIVFIGDQGIIEQRPPPKLDRAHYAVRCVAGRA